MKQTSYIVLNLAAPNYATVYAAQDNLLSRYVSASLFDGNTPWVIPVGTYMEIAYIKPDGTGGFYDTTEDDEVAYTFSGNTVEFVLAQQALTVPGIVLMALHFFNADNQQLSSFSFKLSVPFSTFPYKQIESENYFNVMQGTLAEMAEAGDKALIDLQEAFEGYDAQMQAAVAEAEQAKDYAQAFTGAPRTAATAAAMTDHSLIYVYTGSETGYTNGHWYYWDGTAWADGGVYNSTAFTTDPTLSIAGMAADAAACGDLKSAFTGLTEFNAYNILWYLQGEDRTHLNVEFLWNEGEGTVAVNGTANGGTAFSRLFADVSSLPNGIVAGKSYRFIIRNATNAVLRVGFYSSSGSAITASTYKEDTILEIPSNAVGMYVRAEVASGVTANETIHYALLNTETNTELSVKVNDLQTAVKYSEQILAYDEKAQARTNIDAAIASAMYPYNAVDAIVLGNGTNKTLYGVTWIRNDDGTWTVKGTATDNTFCNILGSNNSVPNYIVPGAKYRLSLNGGSVPVRIYLYYGGTSWQNTYSQDTDITLPDNLTGIILRFQVANGTSYGDEGVTVRYTFIRTDAGGGAILNNSYTYNNTIEKTETIVNNSYTITANPSITTDTNGWLASVDTNTSDETGKTDMTAAIMSMLNETGYCHLGEGIFYVSGNIDMPNGSTIEGCGQNTIIRLLGGVASGYAVKMQKFCTLKNLQLSGGYNVSSTPSSDGGRIGVLFSANSDGKEGTTTTTTDQCWMSDICISGFSGDGLKCHNTSINYAKGLYAINVSISYCYRGINIDYRSEFNKFSNICISWCYIGCVNNGGNNVFTSCTFHATNTGFYIDGTQYNSAHGTVNGCTFCHIGSNNGIAIQCDDVDAGFIFANCQIWYNSVVFNRCTGILLDGVVFGKGIANDGNVSASITVSGGNLVLFNGCTFNMATTRPPRITITGNSKVRFVGCYDTESGNEISAS